MSIQDTRTARRQLARDCVGVALSEALFFFFLAHFHNPEPLWPYALPAALFPVVCALPGLVFGRHLRLLAAARGALIGGMVLVVLSGVMLLLDLQLSD